MPLAVLKVRALGDFLSKSLLIFILLIALSVLAGWHLHLRTLVQISPCLIAMQYNTALCFLLLAASGWCFISQRSPRLAGLTSLSVAIMGAMVTYEYAAGATLGIDTLFFNPWDNTLNAYPGRMAFTSAISFAISGSALTLVRLYPRTLGLFALAHTIPLSLGLTSFLGYLFNITYVLPFHLGSQMALHTSLIFVTYAIIMLHHAWRHTEPKGGGLPKWIPGISIIIAPTLFIGFDAISQGYSVSARITQFSATAVITLLLGLVIHRVEKLKVGYKGLLLIAVPLIFVLAFVGLVRQMKKISERDQEWALHSKEVIVQAEALLGSLLDAESSLRGYVITDNGDFLESYKRAAHKVREVTPELKELVRDNPEQEARAAFLSIIALQRLEQLSSIDRLPDGDLKKKAGLEDHSLIGKQTMDNFRLFMSAFLQEQERLDMARHNAVQNSWQKFDWLLVAGTSADIVLEALLAFLFIRGISKRLAMVTDNTQRLTVGGDLHLPMNGSDEIAHLDRVFHEMAEALSEAARKERAIVENALDVICSIDSEGRFVKVNPACINLWGYSPEELIGRRYTELVAPDEVDKTHQALMNVPAGVPLAALENHTLHKGQSLVCVLLSAFWSDKDNLMFCTARDITSRKQMEVGLANARDVALESARLRAEFLANMSHEIRTPMNGIIGMTELVLNTDLTADQRDHLSMVKSSADALLDIINDILDFSKIEAGKLDINRVEFNLRDCLDRTIKPFMIGAQKKGLELSCKVAPDVPDKLIGDPLRLRQIIINLVGNAKKFTLQGGVSVDVEARFSCRDSVILHFRITDTGIGIPKESQAIIFQSFAQLDDSTSRKCAGTGLGLAITSRLVDLMGGKIWVESEVGKGSTFHLTLGFDLSEQDSELEAPVAASGIKRLPALETDTAPLPIEAGAPPLRVLLAEDNPVNQKLVIALLEKRGHSVYAVGNGLRAVMALEQERFDLVLMDIQMPVMDGFEATALIRERERATGAHIPIIAMTANAMKGDREKCLSAGMNSYLPKPFRADEFFELVEAVARRGSASESSMRGRRGLEDGPNRAALLASVDGDVELLKELSALFLRSYPEALSEISKSIMELNGEGLARAAHSFKGAGALFLNSKALELVRRLEEIGREGRLNDAVVVLTELSQELAWLDPAIHAFAL